ncbi:MAG: type II toxin-antitoxin system VapC family toxin [Anaerolineae bacterium]|nr:MAG: type II toxin-antitoxin system VapC family toxin [Anaerolineae bacterium]
MIILDTHVWVWWVNESAELTAPMQQTIENYRSEGLGVSIISCWEVAKLVELGRLQLTIPVDLWIKQALIVPNVELLDLTPRIVVESTQLPGEFHRDPADQMIVATARVYDIPLLTADSKLLGYSHVKIAR